MGCEKMETINEDNFQKLSHELGKEDRQGSRDMLHVYFLTF